MSSFLILKGVRAKTLNQIVNLYLILRSICRELNPIIQLGRMMPKPIGHRYLNGANEKNRTFT